MSTFLINKSGKNFLYSCVVYKNNCHEKISEELKVEMLSNQIVKNMMQKGQLFLSNVELKKDNTIKVHDDDTPRDKLSEPKMPKMSKFPRKPF